MEPLKEVTIPEYEESISNVLARMIFAGWEVNFHGNTGKDMRINIKAQYKGFNICQQTTITEELITKKQKDLPLDKILFTLLVEGEAKILQEIEDTKKLIKERENKIP